MMPGSSATASLALRRASTSVLRAFSEASSLFAFNRMTFSRASSTRNWAAVWGDGGLLRAAYNYACSLFDLERFEEVKSLLRKTIPVARRVLGEGNRLALKMRWNYAHALYKDAGATLDDLQEAVTTLEVAEPIARRVFGGAHPLTGSIEDDLRDARAVLRIREAQSREA